MPRERHSIIEYVRTEFATFHEKPFSEVDSLLFSKMAYFHWAGVDAVPSVLKQVNPPRLGDLYRAEYFGSIFETELDNDLDHELFAAICASPRFRDVRLTNHIDSLDEDEDKQFSATTFLLPDRTIYVAFRGTDDTLVGWKEDFNLAFVTPVPSQRAAAEYLDRLAARTRGRLRVGGHSKGGNLAVYAAAMCKPAANRRIIEVYSHDGPGFNEQALASLEFKNVFDKVSKSVPESSIIGMLLEHQEKYHVIRSDGVGIMQHDPYAWWVEDGAFVPVEKLGSDAEYMNTTLSAWVAGMTPDQMEVFTDALFDVFGAGGAKTFQGMTLADYKAQASALVNMDPEMRKVFLTTLSELAAISFRSLIPEKPEP